MKRFPFLPVVIAGLLMVAAVGCTTMRELPEDDEYAYQDRTAPGRILVNDPYYGTIVLERDPFTGRYYQVDRYNSYGYSSRYNTYDRYNSYDRNYRDRYGNNTYYGNNRYRQAPAQAPQQTEEQKKEYERQKQEARRRILGKSN
jgi:hypothetical protein